MQYRHAAGPIHSIRGDVRASALPFPHRQALAAEKLEYAQQQDDNSEGTHCDLVALRNFEKEKRDNRNSGEKNRGREF